MREKEKNQLDFIFVLGTGSLGTWSVWSWDIHLQGLSAKGTNLHGFHISILSFHFELLLLTWVSI
jgi:hypothetical protein